MNNLRRVAVLGSLAFICASVSLADSVTYNTSFGPQATDFTNGVLNLPEFNNISGPLAGTTLLDVILTLSVTDTITSLGVTNSASSTQTFTYKSTVDVDDCSGGFLGSCNGTNNGSGPSVSPNDQLLIPTLTLVNLTMTLGQVGSGPCAFASPNSSCNSVSFAPPSIVRSSSASLDVASFNAIHVANYIGTGTFSETAETDTFSGFSGGGGNLAANQLTNAVISASVTYVYNPPFTGVPEPTTLFLMGSALVGVGLLRKRIKS